jgi:hypothetical protein
MGGDNMGDMRSVAQRQAEHVATVLKGRRTRVKEAIVRGLLDSQGRAYLSLDDKVEQFVDSVVRAALVDI